MKTRFFILIAVLSFAGCTRTDVFRGDDDSLTATIDCGVSATKAILLDNPGIRLESRWQGGENIGVFGDGSENVMFGIADADISADGRTARFRSVSGIPEGALTALSPYMSDASWYGQEIVTDIPSVQHYTTNNGVVQPDPSSNFMVASGSASVGLTFRNAMAVLKIGQVFESDITLKSIEFRDLSGAAVCGEAHLSWNGGAPKAEITGKGGVITLDCGEGLSFTAGQKGVFFLVVPARAYPNGFELTFNDASGPKCVRTAGTAKGKTLNRSIVYLIGDVSSREVPEGSTSILKPTAQVMTPEKMDKVQLLSASSTFVTDGNGNRITLPDRSDLIMPILSMIVPKELNPAVNGYLIFDEPTDDLPNGGVYRIDKCNRLNADSYEIVAYPEVNVAAPFEELKAGEPLVNEQGELVEDGGIPLDLTSYVSSIRDEQGNELQFCISDGRILLSEEAMADMLGVETKATMKAKFSSPKVSLNRKDPNMEISVGGSLSLDTRIAVRYMQGEFQYMQYSVTPEITASLGAVLKAEGNIEGQARLYTIDFLPIPVAPAVLVVPQLVLNAKVGVGGSLQVSASLDVTQELGTYSLAYNYGDGGTLRWRRPAIDKDLSFNPSFGGIEGSLYVYGGIGANTNITLYGMCGLGLENYLTFKLGTAANSDGSLKMFLQPEFEVTPSLCFPFGSKKFEDLTGKVEFEPMWEKYIIPKSSISLVPKFNWTEKYYDIDLDDVSSLHTPVSTGVKGIDYSIKLSGECSEDLKVALLFYKGNGISRVPQGPDDMFGTILSKFRAAGIEHLYKLYHMCDETLTGIADEPFDRIIVGTYKAGTEDETFEGTATGSFTQGQAYGVVPALISGDAVRIISIGSIASYYNPFIYWWPNRSNGAPYE